MDARNNILERIRVIRILENQFSRTTMKWKTPLYLGIEKIYADELDFNKLSDDDLVFVFEKLLKRYYSHT